MAPKEKERIVIVGAGIIGVCTAYYIIHHPKFDPEKHHITIIEGRRPASGASGKAGGLLALWAFPQQIVPLSFKLHQELATEYDGYNEWGYRRLDTVSIRGNISPTVLQQNKKYYRGATASQTSSKLKALPETLDFIDKDSIQDWESLGNTETTAQVHPFKFTNFILKKVLDSGHVSLVLSKVTKVKTKMQNGVPQAEGVYCAPLLPKQRAAADPSSGECSDAEDNFVPADKLVLSIGPWTSRILPSCPISGLRAHSITVQPSKPLNPIAVFTELTVSRSVRTSPEIYPRPDEVYICGEGDTAAPVPEGTDSVEVLRETCDELFKYAGAISPQIRDGRILKRQACYLPVLDLPSCPGPFIGETTISNLYLAAGHSCWGINNAPATGKLMSELLFDGKTTSANIKSLDPRLFFDATSENGVSSGSDEESQL